MARTYTSWQSGKSGNRRGRPLKKQALAEMLKVKGDEEVIVGSEVLSGKAALAEAVWQFVLTGEVWLQGKRLEAATISEWLSAVKWLYTTIEPPKGRSDVEESVREMKVNIIRVEKPYVNKAHPLYQAQLTSSYDEEEDETEEEEWDD